MLRSRLKQLYGHKSYLLYFDARTVDIMNKKNSCNYELQVTQLYHYHFALRNIEVGTRLRQVIYAVKISVD